MSETLSKSIISFIFNQHNIVCNFRFPFNWKRPDVYLVTCTLQSFGVLYMAENFAGIPFLFTAFCQFLLDFVKDIERNLNDIDKLANRTERFLIKRKLCDVMHFHSKAKT